MSTDTAHGPSRVRPDVDGPAAHDPDAHDPDAHDRSAAVRCPKGASGEKRRAHRSG